jgi:hypothetical protein
LLAVVWSACPLAAIAASMACDRHAGHLRTLLGGIEHPQRAIQRSRLNGRVRFEFVVAEVGGLPDMVAPHHADPSAMDRPAEAGVKSTDEVI